MSGTIYSVLDDEPLRIRYMPGTGETLVVCFSGVGEAREEEPPLEFVGIASDRGRNHVLFVSDQDRTWLNADGMAEKIAAAIHETALAFGTTRLVGLGNSMGGTMALLMSRIVAFDVVVALVPQFSVHPDVVPDERRWAYFRDRIETWRFRQVDELRPDRTEYFIIHGGLAKEHPHVLRFENQWGVGHFVFPQMSHRLAARLKQQGVLEPMLRHAMNGARGRFRKHVYALGGVFRSTFLAQLDQTDPDGQKKRA